MKIFRFLSIVICVLHLFLASCNQISVPQQLIDKTSPGGTYRVKIERHLDESKGTAAHTERVNVAFLRRDEIIYSFVWENSDAYEPSFRATAGVVEWVEENAVRMGFDNSNEPFYDEVILANDTDEAFTHVGVTCSGYESFYIFDLAPGQRVTLHASPGFSRRDGPFNWEYGYGGTTSSGKEFQGLVEDKPRTSPADGPLSVKVSVSKRI